MGTNDKPLVNIDCSSIVSVAGSRMTTVDWFVGSGWLEICSMCLRWRHNCFLVDFDLVVVPAVLKVLGSGPVEVRVAVVVWDPEDVGRMSAGVVVLWWVAAPV